MIAIATWSLCQSSLLPPLSGWYLRANCLKLELISSFELLSQPVQSEILLAEPWLITGGDEISWRRFCHLEKIFKIAVSTHHGFCYVCDQWNHFILNGWVEFGQFRDEIKNGSCFHSTKIESLTVDADIIFVIRLTAVGFYLDEGIVDLFEALLKNLLWRFRKLNWFWTILNWHLNFLILFF